MAPAVSRKSITPRRWRRHEARVVVQHGRHDAGGAVGGRGHHAPTGGVFFVHGQRVEVDPVQHLQRVAQRVFGMGRQRVAQRLGAALDLEAAGQPCRRCGSRAARTPASRARSRAARRRSRHRCASAVRCGASPRRWAAHLAAALQQFVAAVKGQGNWVVSGAITLCLLPSAATSPVTTSRRRPSSRPVPSATAPARVEGREAHAVGVEGQAFAPQVLQVDHVSSKATSCGPAGDSGPAAHAASRSGWRRRPPCRARGRPGPAARPCRCRGPCRWLPASHRAGCARAWSAAAGLAPGARTNSRAARIGPTVWLLLGPMPILKRSKTLTAMAAMFTR
jgi:hypothetical protein